MLKHWFRNRAHREFEFKSRPAYWKIRRALQKLHHYVARRWFYTSESIRNIGQSSQILGILTKQIVKDVILAVVLFAALVAADRIIGGVGVRFLTRHSPSLASDFAAFVKTISHNYDHIQNFLNTIVQLAGLFLTLYFTAISVIASTVYARVPGDVRTLAVDEKVGNVYIRVVAILGAVSILYLIAGVMGTQIGLIGLIAIGALSILSLFSFLFLGKRTFNFFQPTIFVQYLVNQLARWIKLASGHRRSVQTPSLQDFYRRKAEENLATYRNIVSLATKEEYHRIEPQALVALLEFTIDLATFYQQRKSRISSESFWFEKVGKHRDWLTVGHTELEMALVTGRPADPEVVPNFLWFEEWLQEITRSASTAITSRDDSQQHWFKFATRLYRRLEEFGNSLSIDEAMLFFRSQRMEIESLLDSNDLKPSSASEVINKRLSFCIGSIAFVFSDLMGILIGFVQRLGNVNEDYVRSLSRGLLANKLNVIYSAQLPRAVLSEAESISKSLRAEELVEKRVITPEWYVSQLLARQFVDFIKSNCVTLISELEQTLISKLPDYQKTHRDLFAAQIILSAIEMCSKLRAHLPTIKACADGLDVMRKVRDIPWVEIDWNTLGEKIDAVHKKVMLAAASFLPRLEQIPGSRHWPEYFGQLYSFLARESFFSMARGDEELFTKTFPPLFASSILANQKLREQLKDRDSRMMLAWSSGPIEDIVALSGYAKLFSELDGKQFYEIVTKTWDAYLAGFEDPTGPLKAVTAILEYRTGDFFMPARDLERTTWQQNFERLLRDRGILQDRYASFRRIEKPVHPSPLIQEVARAGMMMEHAADFFLVDYVMPRLKGTDITYPYTARNLATSLSRKEHSATADQRKDEIAK